MLRPYTRPDPPQFNHMRTDFDAELFQQQLAHRAAGHPRHGLARARPLQDVAGVPAIVLERAREVGVAGPGPGHLTPSLRAGRVGFRGQPAGGACALMLVMLGSVITTSPRAVIPNSSWVAGWPATLSLATRSGPMIGSRVWMRFCRLKK